jgi:quercetin dioxygenase-like cupin family protein
MKQLVKWSLVGAALAGVVMAFTVAPGGATPPSGLTSVLLARGTQVTEGTIPLKFGTDIAMVQLTVAVGGSSGWHSHPGGAIVVVQQGTETVHKAVGSQCVVEVHSAGDAFIERPGEVDQVVNTGTIPYVNMVTFPSVPPGASTRIDLPDPGTCPGL